MPERPVDEALEQSTNKWMVWGVGLMVAMALIFPIYRFYEPSSREADRAAQLGFLAEQGSELFTDNCTACHGIDGMGGTAPALNSMQFLEAASNEQISALISVGVPGSQMSAYSLDFGGSLTLQQIEAITTYLRGLEETAPDFPEWRDPLGLTQSG
ncbi:MAG: cytochrome c [Acidimicrobiia bacterium]|nr:cytochrome c [Acidimicrobiia bacterium]MBT8193069.1 cytochrome c [Acidimicrobiia bacterium]MBT8247937.1 cytochrome c [Acidimicrobiia bacterium]NNF87314.1 cytochrome c [Acidimicrobiia bacterium]NNJ46519.1 cytochrome c [Acidimicrobiia bacterium]